MSFHDELEKRAARSGNRPVYGMTLGKRHLLILYINAKGKRVGWYIREGSMKNDKGPFKTKKAAVAAIK
jgi:hypothetical protein